MGVGPSKDIIFVFASEKGECMLAGNLPDESEHEVLVGFEDVFATDSNLLFSNDVATGIVSEVAVDLVVEWSHLSEALLFSMSSDFCPVDRPRLNFIAHF